MMVRTLAVSGLLGALVATSSVAAVDANAPAPPARKPAAPTPARPQPTRPAPDLPKLSAAEIVNKNVAARGGLEAWRKVQSIEFAGKMDVGHVRKANAAAFMNRRDVRVMSQEEAAKQARGEAVGDLVQLPFVMDLQRPRKMRFELQFRGETAIQVYDGEHGWKLRPYLNRHQVEDFTPEELKTSATQQDLDGLLIDYAAKGTKVEADGTDWVENQPTYKLKLTLKTGDVRHVWIDAKTSLDIKSEGSPRRLDGKYHTVTVYSRDYRSIGGLMIAYLLETAVEGVRDTEKVHVEKVVLNPTLDSSRFTKPQ